MKSPKPVGPCSSRSRFLHYVGKFSLARLGLPLLNLSAHQRFVVDQSMLTIFGAETLLLGSPLGILAEIEVFARGTHACRLYQALQCVQCATLTRVRNLVTNVATYFRSTAFNETLESQPRHAAVWSLHVSGSPIHPRSFFTTIPHSIMDFTVWRLQYYFPNLLQASP
jgi:hypothetical protein